MVGGYYIVVEWQKLFHPLVVIDRPIITIITKVPI